MCQRLCCVMDSYGPEHVRLMDNIVRKALAELLTIAADGSQYRYFVYEDWQKEMLS